MNFLKPTKDSVKRIMEQWALHHPRSKQCQVIDLLAEDYAKSCEDMSQNQFQAASDEALRTCKHWPTIAHIREAHERLKEQSRPVYTEPSFEISQAQMQVNPQRARDILEALKTGIKPHWMRQ